MMKCLTCRKKISFWKGETYGYLRELFTNYCKNCAYERFLRDAKHNGDTEDIVYWKEQLRFRAKRGRK